MLKKSIWGPSTWLYLHTITYNYPDNPTFDDKNKYSIFFNNLILPCKECQKEYNNILINYPINSFLNSNHDLNQWLITIHNEVNKRLGKPIRGYNDMVRFVNNGIHNKYNFINIILKLMIIFTICCIIYRIFFLLYYKNGKKINS